MAVGVEETRLWRRVVALKFGEEWGQGCLWVWFMEKYPKRLGGV